MIEDIPAHVKRRKRQHSIAISDEMIEEIEKITKGCISVSGFIRYAINNEFERQRKRGKVF